MKDLINWRVLSKELTGSPIKIRKNYTPKEHREKVDRLLTAINEWRKNLDK